MIGLSTGIISNIQKLTIAGFLLLLLSACGGGVVGDNKNFIVVKDQSVIYLDEIVIAQVTADQDLLIVIYSENTVLQNTKSNEVLGYTAVSAGEYQDVVVNLNKKIAENETLFVELRVDNGTTGELDLAVDTLVVQAVDAVSFGVYWSQDPYLEVWLDNNGQSIVSSSPQTQGSKPFAGSSSIYPITSEYRIDVKKVIASEESWLVAYRINSAADDSIGTFKLSKGHHSDVEIQLSQPLAAGELISLGLYKVSGQASNFDADLDAAVVLNGEPVNVRFTTK